MRKLIKCKVCGFIMEEKHLKDVCPACGVPKTAFIEYKYPISEKRQEKLNLHLHPITVHFPEAIAVFNVGFLILSFIFNGTLNSYLITTAHTLSFFFPISVLIAIATGIYDGKVRFKKLSPPYLRLKIYLGIALFLTSTLQILFFQGNNNNIGIKIFIFIFSLINLGLSTALGKMGGKLIDSRMPG